MDPLLSVSDLNNMATGLRNAGIRSITGNMYTDLSMKDDLPYGWGWCWDDDYGPLSALMVNAKDNFNSDWNRALAKAGIEVEKRNIDVPEIKALGQYEAKAKFYKGVFATLKIEVVEE